MVARVLQAGRPNLLMGKSPFDVYEWYKFRTSLSFVPLSHRECFFLLFFVLSIFFISTIFSLQSLDLVEAVLASIILFLASRADPQRNSSSPLLPARLRHPSLFLR